MLQAPFTRRLLHASSASLVVVWLLISTCAAARPDLSAQGVKAYDIVRTTDTFSSAHVGFAGTTPAVVWAFRDLLAETNADAAFKSLLQEATLPGQLYALCGLWFTDQAEFKKQVARYRAMPGKVKTMVGCSVGDDALADLVQSTHPKAIRLRGPDDTLKAWWARNPDAETRSDIAGGYWPSELKGEKGEKRPTKR